MQPPLLGTLGQTPITERSRAAGLHLRLARAIPIEQINPDLLRTIPSGVSPYGEPSTSPSHGRGRGRDARVPKTSIGIGIETEFLVQARDPDRREGKLTTFVEAMAQLHKKQVPSSCPKMRSIIPESTVPRLDNFDTWTLMSDSTVDTDRAPCKFPFFGSNNPSC